MSVIEEVVTVVGGRLELARILGVSPQFVHQLVKGVRPIPAKRCAVLEAATGITKSRLRPDIFGTPAEPSPEPTERLA